MRIHPANLQPARRRLACALCLILAGSSLYLPASAEGGASAWQKDISFLTAKLQQLRNQTKISSGDMRKLEELESQLSRLNELVAQMVSLAGEIESKDNRLRYLKTMELEPKKRELDRLTQYYEERVAAINEQARVLGAQIEEHNRRRPRCPDDGSNDGVCNPYEAEAADLNSRKRTLDSTYVRVRNEADRELGQASQAFDSAAQESADTETDRGKLTDKFDDFREQYSTARAPLVDGMVAAELKLSLTPFPENSAARDPNLRPVAMSPVGPGTNPHAIDQLRIVTSSSRAAAGRDSRDQRVDQLPEQTEASIKSGYTFDDKRGMAMADLPGVGTPGGRFVGETAPEPLVMPPPPSERADTPAAIKENPKLKAIEQRQSERLKRLDEAYKRRAELKEQGTSATAEQWSSVVKDISTNQGGVLYDEFLKRNVGGSKVAATPEPAPADIDLDYTPKSRRKGNDLVVPPPPVTSPPKSTP